MNLTLWLVTGLLATAYLAGGTVKLVMSKERLAAVPGGGWVEDFSAGTSGPSARSRSWPRWA